MKVELSFSHIDLAIKKYELAAVLADGSGKSVHDTVQDLLECLSGEKKDCCSRSHVPSACEIAAKDIQKALEELEALLGKKEAKRAVQKKYPRLGLIRRFLWDRSRIVALLVALAIFSYWFVTPRKTERATMRGSQETLPEDWGFSMPGLEDYRMLNEIRREVYKMQSPADQLAEIYRWATQQSWSWSDIARWIKQSFARSERKTLADEMLRIWTIFHHPFLELKIGIPYEEETNGKVNRKVAKYLP